jgi:hypothetical protein
MKLDQLIGYFNSRKINLAPPFQRGHVWDLKDRQRLLENMVTCLKWTRYLGPWIAEVKVWSRLPLSFKSSSFLLLLLRLLWVCGQRVCVVQAKRHIHSLRRLDPVHAGTPCRQGKLVVHRLVWTEMIIKGHPQSDAVSRFAPVGIGVQMVE